MPARTSRVRRAPRRTAVDLDTPMLPPFDPFELVGHDQERVELMMPTRADDTYPEPLQRPRQQRGWDTMRWSLADAFLALSWDVLHISRPGRGTTNAWDPRRQARYIESVILGAPVVPIIVLLNDADSPAEVHLRVASGSAQFPGGEERMRALASYLGNSLTLDGLTVAPVLNGRTWCTVCEQCDEGDDCALPCHEYSEWAMQAIEIPLVIFPDSVDGRALARRFVRDVGGA